jgi:hypothetical protein
MIGANAAAHRPHYCWTITGLFPIIEGERKKNSRWVARYSVRFYRFVRGEENLIRPDREIAETWADFQAGRDPVMNWVLRSISDAQKFEVRNPLRIWSDQRSRLLERLDVSRSENDLVGRTPGI